MKVFLYVFLILAIVFVILGLRGKWLLPGKHCDSFSISESPFKETEISKDDHRLLYSLMNRTNLLLGEIEYFLIAGSLLGAVRYQDRMPWDDDIDIGIMEKDLGRFEKLPFSKYNLALKKVVFGYKIYDVKNNRKIGSESVYPFIDVFIFHRKGDRYEYTSSWARKAWPREYIEVEELYPLSMCIYGGMAIPCPNRPIQFLNRVFPGWDKVAYISGSHTGKRVYRKYTMPINQKTTGQVIEYLRTL